MNGLPRVSGKDVLAALRCGGFTLSHVRGSHHYLRRPDGAGLVTIPVRGNRDLPLGTLRTILDQAGLSADELRRLLRQASIRNQGTHRMPARPRAKT